MSDREEKEDIATSLHCVYCFHWLWCKLSKMKTTDFPWSLPHATRKMGLFVTWSKQSLKEEYDLRGCLGTFSDELPISEGLKKYALYSALQDKRFSPVAIDEVTLLKCGVSLLHSFKRAKNLDDWVIGQHGVTLSFNDDQGRHFSATYLPEIASEQNWSKPETIRHLLNKAGFKKSLSSAKNVELTTYESCKAELTWEQCVFRYSSLDFGRHLMIHSFRSFSSLPSSLISLTSDSHCSISTSATAEKEKEKEKEKAMEKEMPLTHKGNSLLSLFTRRYSNSNEYKDKDLSSLKTAARQNIDLIPPSNSNSKRANDYAATNDQKKVSRDDGDESEDKEKGKEKKDDKLKKEKSLPLSSNPGNQKEMKKNKVRKEQETKNTLSAPAQRIRTSSEDSSGIGPSSSSSSCGTLSGDDLNTTADDSIDNHNARRHQSASKHETKPLKSVCSVQHFVGHKNRDHNSLKTTETNTYRFQVKHDDDANQSNSDRDGHNNDNDNSDSDSESAIKAAHKGKEKSKLQTEKKKGRKTTQISSQKEEAHYESSKGMKVSVVVSRTQRERGNDASKRKCSPMSMSPPLTDANDGSTHDEREESENIDMSLRNEAELEHEEEEEEEDEEENDENGDEDEEEEEGNSEMDSNSNDASVIVMTNKKSSKSRNDINIVKKRTDRTCRDEEKRVNSLIDDEGRSDAMTVSEEV